MQITHFDENGNKVELTGNGLKSESLHQRPQTDNGLSSEVQSQFDQLVAAGIDPRRALEMARSGQNGAESAQAEEKNGYMATMLTIGGMNISLARYMQTLEQDVQNVDQIASEAAEQGGSAEIARDYVAARPARVRAQADRLQAGQIDPAQFNNFMMSDYDRFCRERGLQPGQGSRELYEQCIRTTGFIDRRSFLSSGVPQTQLGTFGQGQSPILPRYSITQGMGIPDFSGGPPPPSFLTTGGN